MFTPTGAAEWLARTLTLCLLIAAPASADPLAWREARTVPDLIAHLDLWLDAETDLPRRAPPTIRQINAAQAAALAPPHLGALTPNRRGLYDPDSRTIYLVRPWNPRDPFDVSTLLHELTHHRQAEAQHWYCPGAQELPAYRLQEKWLTRLGLEPDVNWIAVVLASGCAPRDIHPE